LDSLPVCDLTALLASVRPYDPEAVGEPFDTTYVHKEHRQTDTSGKDTRG
jgi:hypothetical protein